MALIGSTRETRPPFSIVTTPKKKKGLRPGSMPSEEAVRRLEAVTDTALARLSLEELLRELLVRVRSILRADTAAILLLNGGDLVARVAKGLEEEVEAGAEVRACQSTAEALAELDTWWPDVLLSDIGMPGEDGYSLIRRVRAREARHGRAIAAVALTAYARADDRRKALSAGFQMHVPKPIDGDDLIAVVVRARAPAS